MRLPFSIETVVLALLAGFAASTPPILAAGASASSPALGGDRASAPVVTLGQSEVVQGRWLFVLPLAPGASQRAFPVADGVSSVALTGIPPELALVCGGGEHSAAFCQRLTLTEGSPTPFQGPVPGVRVKGAVSVGRKPAAGAEISVLLHPLPIRKFFHVPLGKLERRGELSLGTLVKSDEHGRFTIPFLAPGDYRLEVQFPGGRNEVGEPFSIPTPEKLRALQAQKDPKAPPVFDLGQMTISEGLPLQVAVVDRQGKPIAEAGVAARQGSLPLGSTFFHTGANAEGVAVLTGLAPQPLVVSCGAAGYHQREQTFESLPGMVRCVLTRFSGLEGQVVDEEKPVAGVTVTARQTDLSATTDRAGRFAFEDLAAGGYRLVFAAMGYRAVEKPVQVPAEARRTLPPVVLSAAEIFRGKVIDGMTAEPVGGAFVSVTDPPGAGSATSDDDGIFTIKTDSDGSLMLDVSSSRYPAATFEVTKEKRVAPDGEIPTLRLLPGGRIHAFVWDEEAETPCLGCSFSISLPGSARRLPLMATDQSGELLTPLLAPGEYRVSLDNVQSLGSLVQVRGGDNVRVVKVEPGETAQVRFGERKSRLEIAFLPPPPAEWGLWAQSASRTEKYPLRPDGSFQIRKPGGEALRLSLGNSSFRVLTTTLPPDFDKAYLSLRLPATQVAGTILWRNEPLAQAQVAFVSLRDNREVAWGTTEVDGSFSASFLPGGAYRLVVDGQPVQTVAVEEGRAVALGEVKVPESPKSARQAARSRS